VAALETKNQPLCSLYLWEKVYSALYHALICITGVFSQWLGLEMGSLVGLCWTRQFDLVVLLDIAAVEYIGLAERF
jgi:hypothetical protein